VIASAYGREALRLFREQQSQIRLKPERQSSLLDQIPPDAPMDDATITVWNGERFAANHKWSATVPLVAEEGSEMNGPAIPADAACVAGDCGGARVWLVREGERWLMFAGSRTASGRRRDFASPFLAHAIRTAELWYGVPAGGWHVERYA
jgi:hypothetical protein